MKGNNLPNFSDSYQELIDAVYEVGEVPCHSAPDLYFTDEDSGSLTVANRMALELCQQCPVIELCLKYAMEAEEIHGIWGGTSQSQRRLAFKRNRAKHLRAQSVIH